MRRAALLAAVLALPPVLAAAQPQPAPAPRETSLRVVNRSPQAVVEVNASPGSDRLWGHNRLGSETIRPGAAQLVRLPFTGECLHDIRAIFADGRSEQRMGVDLCRGAEFVLTGAGASRPATPTPPPPPSPAAPQVTPAPVGSPNPSFNLVNQTPLRVARVFASPTVFPDWGPNHLGGSALDPGAVFGVRLPLGHCLYDLRIEFEGGASREWRNMDTCRVTNLVLR